MKAVQFTSLEAARTVLVRINSESMLDHANYLPDGTVVVYGLSRDYLFESGAVQWTLSPNGHHHRCYELVGL